MLPAFGAEEEKEWLGKAACPRAAGCSQPQLQVLLSRREEPRRSSPGAGAVEELLSSP